MGQTGAALEKDIDNRSKISYQEFFFFFSFSLSLTFEILERINYDSILLYSLDNNVQSKYILKEIARNIIETRI